MSSSIVTHHCHSFSFCVAAEAAFIIGCCVAEDLQGCIAVPEGASGSKQDSNQILGPKMAGDAQVPEVRKGVQKSVREVIEPKTGQWARIQDQE